MGCCSSSFKLSPQANRTLNDSGYLAVKRSRSSSTSSGNSNISCGSNSSRNNSSGRGSACSTPQRNRSIWSRSQTRPICDDFAEQPIGQMEQERSCGYYTCSSGASTPTKRQLRSTQDMNQTNQSNHNEYEYENENENELEPTVGNLEWEMYMMQHAQRIMPKTSSPISQRRDATFELNSRSYHKWRNYLQSTPAHMLHNVTHIPEAIAGHFCPTDFPAFSDLGEMESAAKRFKVDTETQSYPALQQHLTRTISTDL